MSNLTAAGTAAFSDEYRDVSILGNIRQHEHGRAYTVYIVAPPRGKTSWGSLADLGPAPSAEDIDEMRREVWGKLSHEE